MSSRDYRRSNSVRAYAIEHDGATLAALGRLLGAASAEERESHGAELVASLCAQMGGTAPRLLVLDAPRPHQVRDGRLSYQRLGSYSPRTRTVRLHNRTARLGRVVAPRTFLETLLHELVHHWDFEHLGLARSLHTSGFYHRLGHLKRGLLAASDSLAQEGRSCP